MLVVFDTNVIVSAARYPEGNSGATLQACFRIRARLFISEHLIAETEKTLRQDFVFTREETRGVILRLRRMFIAVQPKQVTVSRISLPDRVVLGTCLAAEADYLVTYDKDLLMLKRYRHTKIVRPEVLRRVL